MAHRQVYPTRTGRYGTRMLVAGEPVTVSGPMAREMIALGRAAAHATGGRAADKLYQVGDGSREHLLRRDASAVVKSDDLTALRAEYTKKLGKKPFNGWDAATLREKIAAA